MIDTMTAPKHPLLEYAESIMANAEQRRGRSCLHIHLSRLRPASRTKDKLRTAYHSFEFVEQKFRGQKFMLKNGDLILFFTKPDQRNVDEVVLRLRNLFHEDPLFQVSGDDITKFSTWFDLVTEHRSLYNQIKSLQRFPLLELAEIDNDEDLNPKTLDMGQSASDGGSSSNSSNLKNISIERLPEIVKKISGIDVSKYIRRQFISIHDSKNKQPRPVFSEIFLSVGDINKQLGIRLTSDKWLFHYITHYLDRKMLWFLTNYAYQPASKAFSLNINVASILSPAFREMDDKFDDTVKRTIMFEMQPMDIYADIGAFMFARDLLHERGYKICIDGLSPLTMPLVNRRALGFDLAKIFWTSDLKDTGGTGKMQKLVHNAGPGRVILCRCDDDDAVRYGRELGMTLFQGRYLDLLLGKRSP